MRKASRPNANHLGFEFRIPFAYKDGEGHALDPVARLSECPMSPIANVRRHRLLAAVALVILVAVAASRATEGAQHATGKCVSEPGTLLRRAQYRGPFQAVRPEEVVKGGETLLALPGDKGTVDVGDGAVRLTLWGDLPELSSARVLESVVVLNDNPGVDLDLTLERGRVTVANRKEKGPAEVRVRFKDQAWKLALEDKGTEVALELSGHWAGGTTFRRDPGPDDAPTAVLGLWVLKGQAALKIDGDQYTLRAPPGPAYFHWDSISGADPVIKHSDKLPAWASAGPKTDARAADVRGAVERQRAKLGRRPAETVFADELDSGDAADRLVSVYGMAATDELARLTDALEDPKHADVRSTAIQALRQWMGRGANYNVELYQYLMDKKHYTAAQAEIVLQLLHGLAEDARNQPETFETLIAYLKHSKLAIRSLAKGQLDAWASAGKDIPYDPAGPEAQREQAYLQWKKLVPSGHLPPHRKTATQKQ
jgi:hypothetical protein